LSVFRLPKNIKTISGIVLVTNKLNQKNNFATCFGKVLHPHHPCLVDQPQNSSRALHGLPKTLSCTSPSVPPLFPLFPNLVLHLPLGHLVDISEGLLLDFDLNLLGLVVVDALSPTK
jgi:hypothetical protein